MKISREIYQKLIFSMPEKPPEIGGIIGGKNGVITHFHIDRGISDTYCCKCSYRPDVVWLNSCIHEWENNSIEFYGIFHCHYGGAESLSAGDISYIKQIMEEMPKRVTKLYFPIIVLPERKIIFYYCSFENKIMNMGKENITIL